MLLRSNVLILGGPSAGKSTLLMQLYGRVATEEGALRLRGAPDSMAAIKDGWDRLQQGMPPAHTPHGTDASLTLPLVDQFGNNIDVSVPDYAGEDLKRLGHTRRVSEYWKGLAAESDHWILVIRPSQHLDIPDLLTRPIGELASAGSTKNLVEADPQLPADMFAVELLQVLQYARQQALAWVDRPLRLTVALSCWDELDASVISTPKNVIATRLALLDSYCRARWGSDYRVIGLSAQGQELREDDPSEDYIDLGPQKMGWLVNELGECDADLTKLIAGDVA